MGQTDGWTHDHLIVIGSASYTMHIVHTSSCQWTLCDVTTLCPPLSPYVTHRHTSLDSFSPLECDVIYGSSLCHKNLHAEVHIAVVDCHLSGPDLFPAETWYMGDWWFQIRCHAPEKVLVILQLGIHLIPWTESADVKTSSSGHATLAFQPTQQLLTFAVGMWQSSNSNSTTFQLCTFSTDSKFDKSFNRFVVECEFVEKSLFYDWFHMNRQPESADKPVFSQIQPSTHTLQLLNVQYNFCSVICYTALIYEHWF